MSFRQSSFFGRLYSSFGQQRKLFLLVFLWTCFCLLLFKSTLFSLSTTTTSTSSNSQQHHDQAATSQQQQQQQLAEKLYARSAAPLYLAAPEFALPDNSNNNALYYSLSSISSIGPSSPALPSQAAGADSLSLPPPEANIVNHQQQQQQHQQAQQSQSSSKIPSSSSMSPQNKQHIEASSDTTNQAANNNQHQSTNAAAAKINNKQPNASQQVHIMSNKKKATNINEQQHVVGSECKYDYPSLFDLQFNNIHWQKMTSKPTSRRANSTTSATFYLYNAYYDDRWRAGLPSVRILAMIDRIQPPPTNCLFWSSKVRASSINGESISDQHQPSSSSSSSGPQSMLANNNGQHNNNNNDRLVPLVTRASFVYAWYPKWGNYKDGILQPWIVTCPMLRSHIGLVPDSVSLVEVPPEKEPPVASAFVEESGDLLDGDAMMRFRRDSSQVAAAPVSDAQPASIAMPPSFSSSSPSIPSSAAPNNQHQKLSPSTANSIQSQHRPLVEYDCKETLPITNNLPVYNQKPAVKEKFAVCVKGLDFPHEDVSVRLVEWIELLNLLGAGKIFLYELDVHENISKVLHYYQKRGIVELSPLTLPGAQPNLPEYQHLYLKSKLTAKRQNELIPYNDCLYRNLNSYQYLALLDIDEIIMPLKHHNWFGLMQEVESLSLSEQNYSRASYNVRNVYFFDDLAGPLGTMSPSSSSTTSQKDSFSSGGETDSDEDDEQDQQQAENRGDSLERGIPHYLHMMQHVYRSKNYTKPGQYVKCFHNTERVVSLHNHFPMNCFGQCTTYSVPVHLAHLQHYRKDCVGPLKQSCKNDFRVFTTRDTTIWKYKQQMIKRTTRVLNHLGLLNSQQ